MKIRMKMTVQGTFHNIDGGVKVGDVVDIDDAEAERYIALGYAEKANQGGRTEEHAVQQFSEEERAVLATEVVGATHKAVPQPRVKAEPKPETEAEQPVKRGPGRPAK